MSEGSWYYAQDGQQHGPMPTDQLKGLLATGQVRSTDLVWTDGMSQWLAPTQVPALAAGPQPHAQPAAAPAYAQGYAQPQAGTYPNYAQPIAQGYAAPPGPATGALNYQTPNYYQGQPQVRYAGFWLRFVAWILDTIIYIIIAAVGGFLAGLLIGFAMGSSGSGRAEIAQVAQVAGNIIGIVVGWLYFALQESSAAQATLGKRVLGLRVTDLNGQRIGFGKATGRYFAKIISGLILAIGYMMAGWTARKQALHDSMAGTLVIKA